MSKLVFVLLMAIFLGSVESRAAEKIRISPVAVISRDGGIPEDGLKFLIEQAKRDVKMTREIPLSEIADFGVLREIQKELGVR